MTRALHRCLTCTPTGPYGRNPFAPRRGYTRHRDRICAACRAAGHRHVGNQVRFVLLADVDDLAAPRLDELRRGVDLTHLLEGIASWHGTDCGCRSCVADRIPGRYA